VLCGFGLIQCSEHVSSCYYTKAGHEFSRHDYGYIVLETMQTQGKKSAPVVTALQSKCTEQRKVEILSQGDAAMSLLQAEHMPYPGTLIYLVFYLSAHPNY